MGRWEGESDKCDSARNNNPKMIPRITAQGLWWIKMGDFLGKWKIQTLVCSGEKWELSTEQSNVSILTLDRSPGTHPSPRGSLLLSVATKRALCLQHNGCKPLLDTGVTSPGEVYTNTHGGLHPLRTFWLSGFDVRPRHFYQQLQRRFWCAPKFDIHCIIESINNCCMN